MYNRGVRRYTKTDIRNGIVFNLRRSGVNVTDVTSIDETPEVLRHSCFNTGVTFLPKMLFNVQQPDGTVSVPYYVCNVCGKVYIYSMKED